MASQNKRACTNNRCQGGTAICSHGHVNAHGRNESCPGGTAVDGAWTLCPHRQQKAHTYFVETCSGGGGDCSTCNGEGLVDDD